MKTLLFSCCLMIALACTKPPKDNYPENPLTDAMKIDAAKLTAHQNAHCIAIRPFYWEVGSSAGKLSSGSEGDTLVDETTILPIGSASQFLFSGYVVEKKLGLLSPEIIKLLHLTSGYSGFPDTGCAGQATVGSCNTLATYSATNDGKFYFSGGHFQKLAVDLTLGALDSAALATEIRSQIGTDMVFTYETPEPAGGILINAVNYRIFLKKILASSLKLSGFLGKNSICTNTNGCSTLSNYTPIPMTETWSYSLGHWVENSLTVANRAYSSPGQYGFYPWINLDKTQYGIIARHSTDLTASWDSVQCGKLIRKAFMVGTPQ